MFEEPDAAWTDDYQWTRYRGPHPYPVPEDWVLGIVEGDGVIWRRYDDAENGHEAETGRDLDDDVSAAGPDDMAMIGHEWPAGADVMEDSPYHELQINDELVLVLKDAQDIDESDGDEWWRAVAEALSRYARGDDYLSTLEDLGLERLKATPFEDDDGVDETERRAEQNRSLGDFNA